MLELEILVRPKPEQPDRFLRPCGVLVPTGMVHLNNEFEFIVTNEEFSVMTDTIILTAGGKTLAKWCRALVLLQRTQFLSYPALTRPASTRLSPKL